MKMWITLAGLLIACALPAQEKLDLPKCRQMALENSKKLGIAGRQSAKATFDKKVYRANFFPKISGMGMYAYMQKDYSFTIDGGYLPTYVPDASGKLLPNLLLDAANRPVIGPDGNYVFRQYAFLPDINLSLGLDNAYTVGGVVEQPVYMGGKIRSAFRMASIGVEMAELNLKSVRAEVITETDEAYWQFLRLKELVVSAGKYKDVVAELVRSLTDAYQTGMASQNDLLKAQVKLNEAELLLQKAQNGEKLAEMNLCRVIGVDLGTLLQVKDSLYDGITPGVLSVDGSGVTARPEYGMLDRNIELKKNQTKLTRADFLPQLGISASYAWTDGISVNGEADGMASFMAMASLKVPVFHWGEGRNKTKAMKAEEEMSELQKEDMVRLMQLEEAKTRFNVEDAAARVRLTAKSLLQAKENLMVSKNRYEVGMESLTNYMEAQAQWQKAWSDWIDAKAELRVSETHYLRATGRLE